jgi:DNA-binding NtrC family response regulator
MNLRMMEEKPVLPKILIVDDEVAMVRSLELLLRPMGEIYKAYSVPEAVEFLDREIDCIISDVNMPEESGLNLLEKCRESRPQTPVIIMTAFSSVPEAVDAMQRGAFEYLMKPFDNRELLSCVRRAIQKKGLSLGASACLPSGWICNSQAMKEFVIKAERMAKHAEPVLIIGETGTGKRRAARWMFEQTGSQLDFLSIEHHGPDSEHPLMRFDNKRFGGLYVAEIFSLSSKLQARLLEILLEGSTKIFGGSSVTPDWQKNEGFGSDLFQAFSIQVLRVPSLRERGDDFDALSRQLLESIAKKMRLKNLEIDDAASQKLRSHDFLGNVKELELILERSAIETKTGKIGFSDLIFESPDLTRQLPFSIPVEEGWGRLEFLFQSLERDLILRAVDKYPELSNTQIASILGTTRRILELRMKSYQIRQ